MSVAPEPARRTRRQASTRLPISFLVINAGFLIALAAVGAVSMWPIYQSSAFVLMAAAALIIATAVALVGTIRRWNGWWVALATFGAYVVGGVPLAVPSALSNPADMLTGLVAVLTAPVTGWKNLLTLELPLGSYQATLAPAYLLLLAAPILALSLAWRAQRLWVLAAPVMLLLPAFGVLFGSSALSDALRVGTVSVLGPAEMVVGISALLLSLGWYVWRTMYERTGALRAAERVSGVRSTAKPGATLVGRIATAAVMLVLAVGAGAVFTPMAVAEQPREVLRTDIDPELLINTELSPLTAYRSFFDEDTYDQVLFTVSAPESAQRVRVATLSFFDGQVARVVDPTRGEKDQTTAFLRVPSTLATEGTSTVTAEVEIGAYTDAWVPLVGELTAIEFTGESRSALADGFFYNSPAAMGVELSSPGLVSGLQYSFTATVDANNTAIAALTPSLTASAFSEAVVPESLLDWIDRQEVAGGGAGLAELIERLRARGFLSHALAIDESEPPQWVSDLGEYSFEPSRAGHSTDRIDRLFEALLKKEDEVGGDDDAALVAAPGNDEQFAVAAAMIADQLGFPARVVLGAVLVADDQESSVPACEAGVCRGANMTAWVEVQDDDGTWHAISVTPQYKNGMAPEVEQRRDPQNITEVEPDHADTILPPESNPSESGERSEEPTSNTVNLAGLWDTLRWVGIGLLVVLVLLGPFLGILLAKLLRRRGRRRTADPVQRITGGWDEYVDTAVDLGRTAPRTHTRQELAALYAADDETAQGTLLATWADRSVFDAASPSDDDGVSFWQIVDAERARLAEGTSWWARLRARLSLRSLARHGQRNQTPRERGRGRARR